MVCKKNVRKGQTRTNMPVAIFALGPINDVEKEWADARVQLDKELAKYP